MQFLVITKQSFPPPPEMLIPLNEAMSAWLAEHRASGKLVQAWSFAGTVGGGGIADVASHEELDEMMVGFPYGASSTIEVYPLADLDKNLASARGVFERMQAMIAEGG